MGTPLPNSSKQVSRSAKSGISLSPSPWKIWARSSLSIRQKSEKKNGSIRPWRTAFSRQKEAAVEPSRIFPSGPRTVQRVSPRLGQKEKLTALNISAIATCSSHVQPSKKNLGLAVCATFSGEIVLAISATAVWSIATIPALRSGLVELNTQSGSITLSLPSVSVFVKIIPLSFFVTLVKYKENQVREE